MKIGVLSDTHGGVKGWEMSWKFLKDTEIILHCGDLFYYGPRNPVPEDYSPGNLVEIFNNLKIPILISKGNCDSEVDQLVLNFPLTYPFLLYQIDFIKIIVSHGHFFNEEEWFNLGKKWKANILISGHTHKWKLEKKEGIILVNPGSPSLPKNEPAVGIIDTELKTVKIFNSGNSSLLSEICL